jgi:hypothetical protein
MRSIFLLLLSSNYTFWPFRGMSVLVGLSVATKQTNICLGLPLRQYADQVPTIAI